MKDIYKKIDQQNYELKYKLQNKNPFSKTTALSRSHSTKEKVSIEKYILDLK